LRPTAPTAPTAPPAERDLRAGGRWSGAQRLKNDTLWALATLVLAFARTMRVATLRRMGRALGLAFHAVPSRPRAIARANVARVLPHLTPLENRALVQRCFAKAGEHLGETVALLGPSGPPPLPIDPESLAILGEALSARRGVVFVSAHLGPWERVAGSLVAAGVPLVTIARESYDPRFTRLYERLRAARGVRVVWRSGVASGAATATRMLRVLRSGGVLGAPMDLRSRVASADVPFLGHPAPTATGPARLALRTGAAVVVGTVAPLPARDARGAAQPYVVTVTRIPTDDQPDAAALTARLNDELSRRILRVPDAWLWMHERWTEPKDTAKRV
jgi:KDO2-lipid IV(A) lauroyltransferase